MAKWEIIKRTFEAKKFPAGSVARVRLNGDAITSQYNPSIKFLVYRNRRRYGEYPSLSTAKTAVNIGKKFNN